MAQNLTEEQIAVLNSHGKILVSASAGSGKTFVMINKIVNLIASGVSVDEILALTFTNKAALNMKEKLKVGLIKYLAECDRDDVNTITHIKSQINKIQIADISTIHAFCAKLIRTYFYLLDTDGAFDVMEAESAISYTLKNKAINEVFEECYEKNEEWFKFLLDCLKYRYSDAALKDAVMKGYEKLRGYANYRELQDDMNALYTASGFADVCAEYQAFISERCDEFARIAADLALTLDIARNPEEYDIALENVAELLSRVKNSDLFEPLPSFSGIAKPRKKNTDSERDTEQGEKYQRFIEELKKTLKKLKGSIGERDEEFVSFMESGKVAKAFMRLVLSYDSKYAAMKRDECKLDFSDLEHYAVALLENDDLRTRLREKYKYVYVDEYQDTNPIQEYLLNLIGDENVFAVGDEKQAIYGFRGSKSAFFAQKREKYKKGDGRNYKLSVNFRSADNILRFVNDLFSQIMIKPISGFDYSSDGHSMSGGSKYDYGDGLRYKGGVHLHVLDKEEPPASVTGVYSLINKPKKKAEHGDCAKAVLSIILRELQSDVYDIEEKKIRHVQPSDICVLTRKKNNALVRDIIGAIEDAGYNVDGYDGDNLLEKSEVKKVLDILSYLENSEQDVPLVASLLSPLGNFNESELAQIKLNCVGYDSFKNCCILYAEQNNDDIAKRLKEFYDRCDTLRRRSKIIGAGKLIDEILAETGLDSIYALNGGSRLKSIRALQERAKTAYGEMYLSEFLSKIKACNGKITHTEVAVGDNIKVMTMHASKGLEFPIVIIADISASFNGDNRSKFECDEKHGFIFERYVQADKSKKETLLGKLYSRKQEQEDLKNEANLFYVACTRAMCKLHLIASNLPEYSPEKAFAANNYAQLADFSVFESQAATYASVDNSVERQKIASRADEQVVEKLKQTFDTKYAYADAINLPVKTSASALLHASMEEEYYPVHEVFSEENELDGDSGEKTDADAGIAYHAYLENCDFAIKDVDGIRRQLDKFRREKVLTEYQIALLSVDKLQKILLMPVFNGLSNKTTWREREFIVRLPANEIMQTSAIDEVLVQGAIDLMILDDDGVKIVDYKFSKKTDEQLVGTYARQLLIYKKAVARILKVSENNVQTIIVNIFRDSQIDL